MLQEVEPKLSEILKYPHVLDGVHASVYRNTQILIYIIAMVNRGDSIETINDVYYFLSDFERETSWHL